MFEDYENYENRLRLTEHIFDLYGDSEDPLCVHESEFVTLSTGERQCVNCGKKFPAINKRKK